jgi:hypothetical protein
MYVPRTPGFQPFSSGYPSVPSFGNSLQSVTNSPSEYTRAGQQRNDHVVVSVSVQSHSVVTSAGSSIQAYRLRLLIGDMIYSFLPVDRDISEFPLILLAEWPTEPASCDDQASMVRGA